MIFNPDVLLVKTIFEYWLSFHMKTWKATWKWSNSTHICLKLSKIPRLVFYQDCLGSSIWTLSSAWIEWKRNTKSLVPVLFLPLYKLKKYDSGSTGNDDSCPGCLQQVTNLPLSQGHFLPCIRHASCPCGPGQWGQCCASQRPSSCLEQPVAVAAHTGKGVVGF